MAKFSFVKGEEDLILHVFIQNNSLTTGLGLAGLDENSSIAGAYVKRNGTGVAVAVDENVSSEGTYEAPSTAAHIRIGTPANAIAGRYELHLHNDLLTTADYVTIDLVGATNMAPLLIEIQLTSINLNDPVRMGTTALPNAAAQASGGLYTRGSGAGQINQDANGRIDANTVRMNGVSVTTTILDSVINDSTQITAIDLNTLSSHDPGATLCADSTPLAELVVLNLDHLSKIPTAGTDMTNELVDNTILSRMLSNGDTSLFVPSTDGLQPIRDRGDSAWTTGGGSGSATAASLAALDSKIGEPVNIDLGGSTIADNLKKLADDNGGATFDATNDSLNKIRNYVAPSGEYDTQLDANMSTRAPSGEYDTQLDANMSSRGTADPGDAMNLATDAIKKVSYDESTAYPLESTDTGVSKIARVGADSDTLETISDQIDLIPTTVMRGTDGANTQTPLTAAETESECNDALVAQKLDHLVNVADSDDIANNAIMAKLASTDGDWSKFSAATDSQQAIRDRGDAAWTTGGGGSGTNVTHIASATLTNQGGRNFEYFFNNNNSNTTKRVNDVGVAGSGFDPDTHDLGDGLFMTDGIRKLCALLFGNNTFSKDDVFTCKDYGGSTTEIVLEKVGNAVTRTTG